VHFIFAAYFEALCRRWPAGPAGTAGFAIDCDAECVVNYQSLVPARNVGKVRRMASGDCLPHDTAHEKGTAFTNLI